MWQQDRGACSCACCTRGGEQRRGACWGEQRRGARSAGCWRQCEGWIYYPVLIQCVSGLCMEPVPEVCWRLRLWSNSVWRGLWCTERCFRYRNLYRPGLHRNLHEPHRPQRFDSCNHGSKRGRYHHWPVFFRAAGGLRHHRVSWFHVWYWRRNVRRGCCPDSDGSFPGWLQCGRGWRTVRTQRTD